jgi:hypothetical protein
MFIIPILCLNLATGTVEFCYTPPQEYDTTQIEEEVARFLQEREGKNGD